MSQKFIKTRNNNDDSTAFGKYFAKAVYDENFVETDEVADYIQTQATLKRSDVKAALEELGDALKHFLELGQMVRLKGIGIFKVGFSSIGVYDKDDCTAQTITARRVIFTPETRKVVTGQTRTSTGQVKQRYVLAKTMVKDVVFEETHDNAMNVKAADAPDAPGTQEP